MRQGEPVLRHLWLHHTGEAVGERHKGGDIVTGWSCRLVCFGELGLWRAPSRKMLCPAGQRPEVGLWLLVAAVIRKKICC